MKLSLIKKQYELVEKFAVDNTVPAPKVKSTKETRTAKYTLDLEKRSIQVEIARIKLEMAERELQYLLKFDNRDSRKFATNTQIDAKRADLDSKIAAQEKSREKLQNVNVPRARVSKPKSDPKAKPIAEVAEPFIDDSEVTDFTALCRKFVK